jgi:hypothetical protein
MLLSEFLKEQKKNVPNNNLSVLETKYEIEQKNYNLTSVFNCLQCCLVT